MIQIDIKHDGLSVALMTIARMGETHQGELADFDVRMLVDRGDDTVGTYRRVLENFPASSLNAVALLKAALNLFDSEPLGLEDDYDRSAARPEGEADLPGYMAGRQHPALRAIQAWTSRLRDH